MPYQLDDTTNLNGVESAAVRSHLERVLRSKCFLPAKRLGMFLSFIVEKALRGESDELKEYVIALEVYSCSDGYDPQVNSTVRVEASRLRTKLRDYYSVEGIDEPVRIELPKGSYVPVFRRIAATTTAAAAVS